MQSTPQVSAAAPVFSIVSGALPLDPLQITHKVSGVPFQRYPALQVKQVAGTSVHASHPPTHGTVQVSAACTIVLSVVSLAFPNCPTQSEQVVPAAAPPAQK